jgi:hypothetical protein
MNQESTKRYIGDAAGFRLVLVQILPNNFTSKYNPVRVDSIFRSAYRTFPLPFKKKKPRELREMTSLTFVSIILLGVYLKG